DLTTGTSVFSIGDASGSTTASDLGWNASTSGDTLRADDFRLTLRGSSLRELAGGAGVSLTTLDIQTGDGQSASIDLSSAVDTAEIIDSINSAGLPLIARVNEAGTGIRLRDVSGASGPLVVSSSDSTAANLGVEGSFEDGQIVGGSLDRQFIDRSSPLTALSAGKAIDSGSILITDSAGISGAINFITDSIDDVGDLIDAINGSAADVSVQINERGDGIVIVDNATGSGTLTIENGGSGTAATDLNLVGSAGDLTLSGSTVSGVNGSARTAITISETDSLASIVEKINAADRYADASIVTNSDGTFSLRLRSDTGGEAGRFGVESTGLDFAFDTNIEAQDAKIAVSVDGGTEQVFSSTDGVFQVGGQGTGVSPLTTATQLSEFSASLSSGSFVVTDSAGNSGAINLAVDNVTTTGELIDQINSLGIGVQATIDEDNNRIALIDTANGSETLSVRDIGSGVAASILGFTGEPGAADVNDQNVTAILGNTRGGTQSGDQGLTLTLKELSTSPVTIDISRNDGSIADVVSTFVDQYNALVDRLDSLTFFNADANEVGLLFGSSEAQRIRSGYGRLISGVVNGVGNVRTAAQVGIGFEQDGKLSLDRTKLLDEIESNRDGVEAFFATEQNGFASRLDDLANQIAGIDNSLLSNRTSTLSTQIDRNNDRVTTLDGRLERQRERLLQQFFETEQAIARIQSNQSAISSIQPISIPNQS
ncbi:MAG: flagellar filament capping protein FliD, partial [Planctomycetota bacterium]